MNSIEKELIISYQHAMSCLFLLSDVDVNVKS